MLACNRRTSALIGKDCARAILRLSSANLIVVKRQMGRFHSAIGSAHRTEALAAACGYRTYAAMLADMRASMSTPPLVKVVEQRWAAKLLEYEYSCVPDVLLTTDFRFQKFPDPCWVEFHSKDRAIARRWFHRSKAEKLPYVTIETKHKYADLDWDCITIEPALDDLIRGDTSGALARRLFSVFQRSSAGSGAKPFFSGSAFVGSIRGLQPDVARMLADEFALILNQEIRPSILVAA